MKKVDLLFCGDKKRRLSVCLSTALSYSGLRSRLSVESENILNDWAVGVKLNCKSFHYKLFIGFNNLSKLTLLIVINTNPERGRAVNIRKDESYGIF